YYLFFFFFSSRRRHTRWPRDWSSDVCSSDLAGPARRPSRCTCARDLARAQVHLDGRRAGPAVGGAVGLEAARPARLGAGLPRSRSEERRVGKECRERGWGGDGKEKVVRGRVD